MNIERRIIDVPKVYMERIWSKIIPLKSTDNNKMKGNKKYVRHLKYQQKYIKHYTKGEAVTYSRKKYFLFLFRSENKCVKKMELLSEERWMLENIFLIAVVDLKIATLKLINTKR